jgi:hypothetical protein
MVVTVEVVEVVPLALLQEQLVQLTQVEAEVEHSDLTVLQLTEEQAEAVSL